jgi:hypothetical protein
MHRHACRRDDRCDEPSDGVRTALTTRRLKIRAVVQDHAADSDANRTTEIPHHVEEAARVLQTLRRQTAEAEVDGLI